MKSLYIFIWIGITLYQVVKGGLPIHINEIITPSTTAPTSVIALVQSTKTHIAELFDITFSIMTNDCIDPTVSVTFEEIDFNKPGSEYFDVLKNDGTLIKRCTGNNDRQCRVFKTCMDGTSLDVEKINAGSTYTFQIETSTKLAPFCEPYSLNTKVMLNCGIAPSDDIFYVGCYMDVEDARSMRYGPARDGGPWTIQRCKAKCMEYAYYGLQFNGNACRCDNDFTYITQYGPSDACINGLGGALMNSVYATGPRINVVVTACNGWNYASITNSMQIQLSTTNGVSEYFYVNQESQLPVNGESKSFEIILSSGIGEIYGIQIMVHDKRGFCISKLQISHNAADYVFDGPNYFGSGIILASECSYSYRFISDDHPLIQCHPKYLELFTYAPRGIYNLNIHSCIGDNNGISAENMKNNVYVTIMGKKNGEQTYTTTTMSYLDHFESGEVNIMQLGDLIAGNVLITSSDENALYSSIGGRLIGMKLEMTSADNKFTSTSSVNIKTNNNVRNIPDTLKYAFENGKYLVVFFDEDNRVNLDTTQEIYIYGGSNIGDIINVFAIFEGKEDEYALSFKIGPNGDEGFINWFSANDECKAKYGTSLASIHSEEENFLINGFQGDYRAWIGFKDIPLQTQNSWQWIDGSSISYTNWQPGEPNEVGTQGAQDCAEAMAYGGLGVWDDLGCNDVTSVKKYVCSSPYWSPNAQRLFQINQPEVIDDITLISIGNNHKVDALCVDSVIIDDKPATYISDNIIGGPSGPFVSTAIIKYPVCKTEVAGFRVDYETSKANVLMGDSSIAGLECKNGNRLIPSTCSISQSYELSKTTSFAISNENSATSEYSWGSSSSVSFGSASSTTTSDEFSFGFDQSITVGTSATVGGGIGVVDVEATVSTEVSVGSNQQWTSSTEQSNERSSERSNENNEENTESNTQTDTKDTSWETSETTSIECAAEIEVPPSHSVKYSLIFNAFNTTINTYTDIKLTLCSAFINPENSDDESHYVYIDNIPGVINHKETTSCVVQFNPAEYIRNDLSCDEEQRLAFSSSSNYIPRCQSDDPSLYAPCQCNIGDTDVLSQCMCVDSAGNILTNKLMHVEDGDGWQRICIEELECGDSSVVLNSDTGGIVDKVHIDEPRPLILNISNWTIESLIHLILEVMGILFLGFGMYYIRKYVNHYQDNKELEKEKLMNYEECEHEERIPIKDDME